MERVLSRPIPINFPFSIPFPVRGLLTLSILTLALRFALVLTHDNILGVDGGAYLFSANEVRGLQEAGTVWPRPPLAPGWLLVPFLSIWGEDIGFKIFSALFSLAPVVPVYLLSRKVLSPNLSLLATFLVVFDIHLAEMLVTGVMPLVGFSLITLAIWAMWELAEKSPRLEHSLILVLTIPLIAFTNQTSAGLFLILAVTFLLASGLFWRGASNQSSLGPLGRVVFSPLAFLPTTTALALGGILALSALPWYLDVAPGSELVRYPGPIVMLASFSDTTWIQFVSAIPVGLVMVWKGRDYRLRSLGVVVLALAGLAVLMSRDEAIINIFYRSRYLLQIPLMIGVVWIGAKYLSQEKLTRFLGLGLVVLLIPLLVYLQIWTFHNQARLSDHVTADTYQALQWLEREHPGEGIIANTYSMSVWVEALNLVPSPPVWNLEPPPAYQEQYGDVACVVGWDSGCDWEGARERLGIGWVLVDERYPFVHRWGVPDYLSPGADQWVVTGMQDHLSLVYSRGQTRLYEVRGER